MAEEAAPEKTGPAFEALKGEVATFVDGAKLFSNRPLQLRSVPESLKGFQFVRAPIDFAQTFICTKPGVVYVLTPAGPDNSIAENLEAAGFEKQPIKAFMPFGSNVIDQSVVFRKELKEGDRLRTRKWAILLAEKDLGLTLNDPSSADWTANSGEVLYNGIVLPKIWPPINMDSANPEPMPVPYLKHPPKVIPIDVGRQLFVDDFLVEKTDLKRTFYKAEKFEHNPVFKAETEAELATPEFETNDKSTVFLGHGGVFWDPSEQIFKMFYMAGWRGGLAMATSKDLVHWTRPDLGIAGGNLILARGTQWSGDKLTTGGTDNAVWLDLETTNPAERLKYLTCWMHAPKRPPGFHHSLHVSADGKAWTDAVPVKPAAEDYSSFFYNPFRKVWVFSMKGHGANGRNRNYFEAKEFLDGGNQFESVYWTGTDKLDQPEPEGGYPGAGDKPQLYSLGGVAYESIIVGMHYIHRGPNNETCVKLKIPKLLDLELGFSRDGFHWDRTDRETFIKGSRTEGSWDRAYLHSTTGMFAVIGDKLVFPYMGTSGVAADGSKQLYSGGAIGLAMIRRDGFASMDAGDQAGQLTTRPIEFTGKRLFVNAQVPQGSLKAEVRDLDGNPIAPYTLENSLPFTGDSTLTELTWKGGEDLSSLAGKPVRLHFELTKGSLYAFWVSPDESGRSNGYVAAGGPGFTGSTDTVGKVSLEAAKEAEEALK